MKQTAFINDEPDGFLQSHPSVQLAASLAHEICDPLTAIANFAFAARMMLQGIDTPNAEHVHDLLTKILDQNDRAGEIARRLRRLAQSSATDDASPRQLADSATAYPST